MAKEKKSKTKVLSDKDLKKKYPGFGIASEISLLPENLPWLPSRNMALNYTLGGGIPFGKILELFGEESSGKSLTAIDFAYCCQKLGGMVIWEDAEQAFDRFWMEKNGLNMDQLVVWNQTAVEPISDWAADMALYWRSKLTNNEPILFVLDSVAALDCLANINSEQTEAKAEMGNRAKAIYKFLRIRNQLFAELGITSIFINQLRKKVGATQWEDPDATPGGAAMKFFASQRVGVYGGKQIKKKIHGFEERVGRNVSVRIKKNKVAAPKPTFKTEVYFHEGYKIGFDKYLGLEEILFKEGVLTKESATARKIYFKKKVIATSKDELLEVLATDQGLRKLLLRKAGINTISKTKRVIEKLEGNLYPITNKVVELAKKE